LVDGDVEVASLNWFLDRLDVVDLNVHSDFSLQQLVKKDWTANSFRIIKNETAKKIGEGFSHNIQHNGTTSPVQRHQYNVASTKSLVQRRRYNVARTMSPEQCRQENVARKKTENPKLTKALNMT
jgi:hypothetical protein